MHSCLTVSSLEIFNPSTSRMWSVDSAMDGGLLSGIEQVIPVYGNYNHLLNTHLRANSQVWNRTSKLKQFAKYIYSTLSGIHSPFT